VLIGGIFSFKMRDLLERIQILPVFHLGTLTFDISDTGGMSVVPQLAAESQIKTAFPNPRNGASRR
jgi:hypothetical protein